jgi:hypothetical protein
VRGAWNHFIHFLREVPAVVVAQQVPSICRLSGGNPPNAKEGTWKTSPSPTTHDTSRSSYHIKDISSFAEDLQNVLFPPKYQNIYVDLNKAADRAFPNHGRSRYQTINVCLIRWAEDDLEVKEEYVLKFLEQHFLPLFSRESVFSAMPEYTTHKTLPQSFKLNVPLRLPSLGL